jgi:hypothetical protein
MGDYTKNGTGAKIGTCGRAYYATKGMLEKIGNDNEANWYLNPANKAFFAFPFPEFDGKQIGDISVFHTEERDEFMVRLKSAGRNSYHGNLVFHKHPAGGEGLNFFCDCPYHNNGNTSRNFNNEYLKFYLKYQTYYDGRLTIAGECIYCRELNIFDEDEIAEMCHELHLDANYHEEQKNDKKATKIRTIIARMLNVETTIKL